jgi:hypothetical protein
VWVLADRCCPDFNSFPRAEWGFGYGLWVSAWVFKVVTFAVLVFRGFSFAANTDDYSSL